MKFKIRNLKWAVLALVLPSFGADVTISVNPPLITMGESAQVKIEVRDAKRLKSPTFPKVDGLSFSGVSQSTHQSWVNGKSDSSTSFTVTVYPQKTGEFVIGPFEYKVDGETKTLRGKLKVVATSGEQAQSWDDLVFAKITSSRDKAYVQEPFELTLSIYSRTGLQLAGNIDLRGMPETGLSEPEWKELGQSREQVNGQVYDVRRFKAAVRALGSGVYDFAPTVVVQVAMPNQKRQRDPFGFDSFFNRVQTRPVELTVETAAVEVLPLPATGKPAGFSGAVGRFNFQTTADPKKVSPGDPITLQMTIVGEGNVDRILPPVLPEDDSFRLFGDAVRQQGNNGVRFEQVISPRTADVKEIPAIEFSFFDTETGEYRTVSSRAIPLTVTASSNEAAQVFAAKETLIAPPQDQPFATESDVQRFFDWLSRIWETVRPWLWVIPAALGAGLSVFFVQKFYHWRRKDTAWLRRQKAPKAARQALHKAGLARKKGDARAFYNALDEALSGYFGNRLNLPPGDVTADRVLHALREREIDGPVIGELQNLFETIELQRYGFGQSAAGPEEMKSTQVILEKTLKKSENLF